MHHLEKSITFIVESQSQIGTLVVRRNLEIRIRTKTKTSGKRLLIPVGRFNGSDIIISGEIGGKVVEL